MTENAPERFILFRSRLAEGYSFSESGRKNVQHVFTDWIPRAIYADLTDDTVSVDVDVSRDFASGRSLYNAVLKRSDGSVIKKSSYAEDRLIGKVCPQYNPKKSKYDGNRDGYDHRLVYYDVDALDKTMPMPRALARGVQGR